MKNLSNRKKLEKRIYQTIFQDGIYDITWGLMMLALAVNPLLFEATSLPRGLIFMAELLVAGAWLFLGKEFITRPRMGSMVPTPRRQHTARRVLVSGIILLILIFLLVNFKISGTVKIEVAPLVVSIVFLILFTVLSVLMSYSMLFVAGLLFAISIPVSEVLYPLIGEPLDSLIPFGFSALIILGIGLYRFINFVKRYPVEEEDSAHVS